MSDLTLLARHVADSTPTASSQRAIMLSGTLGSGKTTVLAELLSDVRGEPFIVIQNDIGAINTDTRRLKLPPEKLCALTAGCICCNDLRALDLTLDSVRDDDKLRTIFIETTGIANPAQIKDLLHTKELPTLVIVTVDVAHFERNLRLGRIAETVPVADVLVLTHVVNAEGEERDISGVIGRLREYNKRSDILKLSLKGDERTFEEVTDCLSLPTQSAPLSPSAPAPSLLTQRDGWVGRRKDPFGFVRNTPHAQFTLDLIIPDGISSTRLVEMITQAIPDGIQRAKGYVHGEGEIDCICGEWRLTSSSPPAGRSYCTLIHNKPLTSDMFPELLPLNEAQQSGALEGEELAVATALVEELIQYFPKNVVDDGRLITETDAGESWLYTERAGFPEELRDRFLHAWTRFYNQQQEALSSGAFDTHPDLPYYQRKVGNTLSWLLVTFPEKLREWGLEEPISRSHPAELFFRGLEAARNPVHIGSFKTEDVPFFLQQLDLLERELGPEAPRLADRAVKNCVERSNDENWAIAAHPLVERRWAEVRSKED